MSKIQEQIQDHTDPLYRSVDNLEDKITHMKHDQDTAMTKILLSEKKIEGLDSSKSSKSKSTAAHSAGFESLV